MALAQSVVAVISIMSFTGFISQALQVRDPHSIDWQSHFYAGVCINSIAVIITLIIALGLSYTETYRNAALPLAVLTLVFIIDIPASIRQKMTQVNHDWIRYRSLLLIGTLLGSGTALAIAFSGGGVWALVAGPILFGVPAVIDLFFIAKWRASWSIDFQAYKEVIRFGALRSAAGLSGRGRNFLENSWITNQYGFELLGLLNRAQGLVNLTSTRIVSMITESVYPVITRAQPGSEQFKRYAALILRTLTWTIVPLSFLITFLGYLLVMTLYGDKWMKAVELLLPATLAMSIWAIVSTFYVILLANDQVKSSTILDVTSNLLIVGLVIFFVPLGVQTYLWSLFLFGAVWLIFVVVRCSRLGAVSLPGSASAIFPALVAAAFGATPVMYMLSPYDPVAAITGALTFTILYFASLRLLFSDQLKELLNILPFSDVLLRIAFLSSKPT